VWRQSRAARGVGLKKCRATRALQTDQLRGMLKDPVKDEDQVGGRVTTGASGFSLPSKKKKFTTLYMGEVGLKSQVVARKRQQYREERRTEELRRLLEC